MTSHLVSNWMLFSASHRYNQGPLSHAGIYTCLGDEISHMYFTNRSVKLLLIKQAQDKADPGLVQLWFKGMTLRVSHGLQQVGMIRRLYGLLVLKDRWLTEFELEGGDGAIKATPRGSQGD